MTGSRVHDAITALVAALEAEPSVTALATVIDGPVLSGDAPETAVFVGYSGDPGDGMAATANWTQTWAGLGAGRRDEQFDVLCAVVSWSGETDVAARRQTALAAFDAVATTLRATLNIGLGLPQPTIAEMAVADLLQEQTAAGLQARIPFVVRVKTRV